MIQWVSQVNIPATSILSCFMAWASVKDGLWPGSLSQVNTLLLSCLPPECFYFLSSSPLPSVTEKETRTQIGTRSGFVSVINLTVWILWLCNILWKNLLHWIGKAIEWWRQNLKHHSGVNFKVSNSERNVDSRRSVHGGFNRKQRGLGTYTYIRVCSCDSLAKI